MSSPPITEVSVPTTILIADDRPSMRLLVRASIEAGDYSLIEASDGEEAWALIQSRAPALVLLDVQMPHRSGLELLAAIRTDANLAATKVILLTARALDEDIATFRASGADSYLTKPFSPAELVALVEEVLRREPRS
jgi:DNA-binding response OmpR family regulator